jgi:hypothetical protein
MVVKMAKRPSKVRQQSRVVAEPGEARLQCPYCGTVDGEKSALSLLDQLLQSHSELSARLRLAGRQMLRFENQGGGSLEKVREALKRADNIRKTLHHLEGLPRAPKNIHQHAGKRTSLNCPPSVRIIKFSG